MIEILLATCNGEKYLEAQLISLLGQSFKEWNVLIHDDGSTDNTVKIIEKYQAKFPEQIIFLNDGFMTGGAKNNFSHLMFHTSSPYIMFCDQDDIWNKDKVGITLNKMRKAEKEHPGLPILVHTDLEVVDGDLHTIAKSMLSYQRLPKLLNSLDEHLVQNIVTGCTVMINRNAVEVSLPIPVEAIMHDWWVTLKVLSNHGAVVFVEQSTILYRQHDANSVGSKKVNLLYLIKKLLAFKTSMELIHRQAFQIKNTSAVKLIFLKIKLNIYRFFT